MSATFNNNDYTTPPSTPRRLLAHEAYFPPRSHLVGLGLDFEFPPQSSIVTAGLDRCSAPRLGPLSSPYEFGNGNGNDDAEETRCASYWSADSSVSTASRRLRRLRSESEIEEDEMMENRTCASSSLSTSSSSSKFVYSPFAGAAISPSSRISDTFSTEIFGLGLSLHDDEEEEEDDDIRVQVPIVENENDAWSRQSAWSFECLESPRLPYAAADAAEDYRTTNIDREDIFGFRPAPSYSYALSHTSFSLLPAANIPTSSSLKFPSLSSGSPLPSILKAKALSSASSSSSLATSLEGSSSDDLLIQSSKVGNDTGNDPFSANYNAIGERKRKRKESSIFGSPAPAGATRSGREESENVKRLKSSPALKHLGIFTHTAILEEREQVEKQTRFADALSGLSVDRSYESPLQEGGRTDSLSPSYPTILLEPTPELGSPSPSPSMRTVDCTLLVSNMPSESRYPPTPSSSAFAPFVYSSTIDSMASPSSSTFQEEVKKDICHKLSLSNMGLSVNDVNVFPSLKSSTRPRSEVSTGYRAKSPRCGAGAEASDRRGMVVVVHTA